MLNVKSTIYKSLTSGIARLRKLADNNTVLFKKILYLIIIDDLFDWSDYLDESQEVLKKLKDLRINFIRSNPELSACYDKSENHYYTNVNTPQTNNTWKRVFDSDYHLLNLVDCIPINDDNLNEQDMNFSEEDIRKISEQLRIPTTIKIVESGELDNKYKFEVSTDDSDNVLDIMDESDLDFIEL